MLAWPNSIEYHRGRSQVSRLIDQSRSTDFGSKNGPAQASLTNSGSSGSRGRCKKLSMQKTDSQIPMWLAEETGRRLPTNPSPPVGYRYALTQAVWVYVWRNLNTTSVLQVLVIYFTGSCGLSFASKDTLFAGLAKRFACIGPATMDMSLRGTPLRGDVRSARWALAS